MAQPDRPLSPHLQVYRWQITNTLSILHRLTGVALGAGTLLMAYWLIAIAAGPEAFAPAAATPFRRRPPSSEATWEAGPPTKTWKLI